MAKQTAEKSTRLPKKEAVEPKKNGGARPGAGRKPFEPTDSERKQVEALSGYGVPFEQIAALVRDGIHVDTLREKFSTELVNGKAKANAQVGKGIFQKAMAGDTTAQIWWSKCQMGWKDVQRHEVTGKDGAPIAVATLDVSKLDTGVLAQIMAAKDATDAS
jgi:hypothetical protein